MNKFISQDSDSLNMTFFDELDFKKMFNEEIAKNENVFNRVLIEY